MPRIGPPGGPPGPIEPGGPGHDAGPPEPGAPPAAGLPLPASPPAAPSTPASPSSAVAGPSDFAPAAQPKAMPSLGAVPDLPAAGRALTQAAARAALPPAVPIPWELVAPQASTLLRAPRDPGRTAASRVAEEASVADPRSLLDPPPRGPLLQPLPTVDPSRIAPPPAPQHAARDQADHDGEAEPGRGALFDMALFAEAFSGAGRALRRLAGGKGGGREGVGRGLPGIWVAAGAVAALALLAAAIVAMVL